MTVRERRRRRSGMAALALPAGASLLRSAMAVAAPRAVTGHTLNLRLAQGKGDRVRQTDSGKWALQGAPAKNWKLAEAALAVIPTQNRDGLRLLAMVVRIGRDHPMPVLTNAVTAGELISALGVELGKDDQIKPS